MPADVGRRSRNYGLAGRPRPERRPGESTGRRDCRDFRRRRDTASHTCADIAAKGRPAYDPFRRYAAHPGARFAVAFAAEVVMLPSFSRGLRLALVLALSAGYVTWHG